MKKKQVKILFIGNSHTYYHDLPAIVAEKAENDGYDCQVTLLAHPGWYLKQHVEQPDVRFNIKYGHYDYVVLQEHSHPFDHIDDYQAAAEMLNHWITEAGSKTVIYGTWSRKAEGSEQERMNLINRELADHLHAVYAQVGESWWSYLRSWPNTEMYEADGEHASEEGMLFVAKMIWTAISSDIYRAELIEKAAAKKKGQSN